MVQSRVYMKKMQEQMDNIHQPQAPQERQKLLPEHWATMQDNMQLMHDIFGPYGGIVCCMRGPKIEPGKVKVWPHMGDQSFKLTAAAY
jgi:hypothetical protein